jgi:hypothetical protein
MSAKPLGARLAVERVMTMRKKAVRTISATKQASSE